MANKQGGQKVTLLPGAQGDDVRFVGRSLDATVPGLVFVDSIPVFLAIGQIVFLLVAHQVVQRETIVRGDEIDAGIWPAICA